MRYQTKYNSKKMITEDGTFDSKKEYARWLRLKRMEKEGKISHLKRQVVYELIPNQRDPLTGKVVERAIRYIADFSYEQDCQIVVEDVKSPITKKKPEYVIKRKLMLWRYGIKIKEIDKDGY